MIEWFKGNWPMLIFLGFVGGIIGAPLHLIHKSGQRHEERARLAEERCGMYSGDIVEAAIDGRRGMVTEIYSGYVWVRFAQPHNRTNVSLLGADGAIDATPYTKVRMACFELRKVQSSVE